VVAAPGSGGVLAGFAREKEMVEQEMRRRWNVGNPKLEATPMSVVPP